MTDQVDAEAIAARLSPEQRAAMVRMPDADYYGRHEVYCNAPTLRSLIKLGLSGDHWPDRMTELGEAVRDLLMKEKG